MTESIDMMKQRRALWRCELGPMDYADARYFVERAQSEGYDISVTESPGLTGRTFTFTGSADSLEHLRRAMKRGFRPEHTGTA